MSLYDEKFHNSICHMTIAKTKPFCHFSIPWEMHQNAKHRLSIYGNNLLTIHGTQFR
jgi:hypothetical protein